MKLLEDKIKSCGKTVGSDIVKVDMFLNHQVDPVLMHEIGKEFKRLFANEGITKVLTIEVSGIAPAVFAALELNVPLVVGGAINWYVTSRSKDAALNAERGEKGTLLASGFIAGGALMGVASAAMRFGGINLVNDAWLQNTWSEVLALGAYAILIFYLIKASMKTK